MCFCKFTFSYPTIQEFPIEGIFELYPANTVIVYVSLNNWKTKGGHQICINVREC